MANLGAPQLILILLVAYGLGTTFTQQGKPKPYPFYNTYEAIANAATLFLLLLWGGFFSK